MEKYLQYPQAANVVQEWAASTEYTHEVKAKNGGCLTTLSIDIPESVTLEIKKNNMSWFKSDGNEKGTLKFCGIPFDLLNIIINNTTAEVQVGHVRLVYHS